MMELYSVFQTDYDYFDHRNVEKFNLFKVSGYDCDIMSMQDNFEKKAFELENQYEMAIKSIDTFEEEEKEGN